MKINFFSRAVCADNHLPIADHQMQKEMTLIDELIGIMPRIKAKVIEQCRIDKQVSYECRSKRVFDISLAGFGLLLSSWLWVLIILAIIIEDGLPVIIRQKRVGKGGILFNSLKFRSMIKASLTEKVQVQAAENDPRVTRTGKILRRTALDELPQLLNILLGEMSFVGPRALLPSESEINGNPKVINIADIPGYNRRIIIRPGLTGISQVFASRDLPRRHKFKYDLLYIRKMGIIYDLKLIISSFLVTFSGAWEKRSAKLKFLLARNNHYHDSISAQK
jgi:lipopolysaccharide/colanic/teichoic acid biosynthesis glycosyltransferase